MPDRIIEELDRIRDEAQAAFIARDADAYMRMFSPEVSYKSAIGNIVFYDRLDEDVQRQLRVRASIKILRERERYEFSGDRVIETVTQNTSLSATAFFLLTRTLEITRKGKYVWMKTNDGWRVTEVEILSEDIRSHWALGFVKPRRIF